MQKESNFAEKRKKKTIIKHNSICIVCHVIMVKAGKALRLLKTPENAESTTHPLKGMGL